jgi:hypothetical protein
MHYAAALWRLYGVNVLDQDRLEYGQFLHMCQGADRWQREVRREKDA